MKTIKELIENIENNWATTEAPEWIVCSLLKCANTEELLNELKRLHGGYFEQLLDRLSGRRAMRFMTWATAQMIERKRSFPPSHQSLSVTDLVREYDAWCVREAEAIKERGNDGEEKA